jgi:hypothetical protein
MAYDSKCFDLAQYFLGCKGDDGDEMQASLAQALQDAWDNWFVARAAPDGKRQAEAVAVKPLEWREPTDHPKDPDEDDSLFCADGIGGVYSVSVRQSVGPAYLLWWAHDPMDWAGFDTVEAAKAAAQADFEARIRSALSGGWQAEEEAIRHLQNAKPIIQRMPQTPARDEALQCFDRAEDAIADAPRKAIAKSVQP